MVSDVEKVCMDPLVYGVFGLTHILFVAYSTGDQVYEVQALAGYAELIT